MSSLVLLDICLVGSNGLPLNKLPLVDTGNVDPTPDGNGFVILPFIKLLLPSYFFVVIVGSTDGTNTPSLVESSDGRYIRTNSLGVSASSGRVFRSCYESNSNWESSGLPAPSQTPTLSTSYTPTVWLRAA